MLRVKRERVPFHPLLAGQLGYNRFFGYAVKGLHISQASRQNNLNQFLTAALLLSRWEGQLDKCGEEDIVTASLMDVLSEKRQKLFFKAMSAEAAFVSILVSFLWFAKVS